ncbi:MULTISPECIES: hypothetical protein [unclassified Cupriavidus]|uniref:hypothetical protein n=1 Tax=unclassified Cupriavidus TaxID=2640874 RepID=UPI00313D7707
MPKLLDKSWVVFESLENPEGNRCVDLFTRPDRTFGFEEFRKDPEDGGVWTSVRHFANQSFASRAEALAAARRVVPWLIASMAPDGQRF